MELIEKIKELEARVLALEELLRNIYRVGTVVGRDPKRHMCRVQFKDNDRLVSYWCQVVAHKTYRDKFYWLPDVGELVHVLFLPFGKEQGVILGSAYNKKDEPPDGEGNKLLIKDSSGNTFEMNRDCGKVRFITGELHVFGNLVVHGTIYDSQGDLTNHTNAGKPRDASGGVPPWGCS